jgi:hypothetical protein
VGSRRLDDAQAMESIITRLGARYTDDRPIALVVVGDWLAWSTEQSLVHLGIDTPRWTTVTESLPRRKLQADEAAFVVDELGYALSPSWPEI